MQKTQGYCSYCRVQYPNLEQHLLSAQHRDLTRQSRRRTTADDSLMERFMQDVLDHHPDNYQDNSSAPNEAAAPPPPPPAAAAAAPAAAESPEVIVLDDSDEKEDDSEESSGEMLSEDSESVEEIECRPGTSQECAEVPIRPSVIQRLERGQQQSLELAHRVESGVKTVNAVGGVQATTRGEELVRPPVICNAPASSLPRGSVERPVAANSVPRLALAVASDSFPACDTENLDTYFDPPDQGSSNSQSRPKAKDPKKKPLSINLDKLLAQRDLRAKGASFSPVVRVRELTGAELCSLRVESSSESGAGAAGNLSETDTPSDAAREGAIPKRLEASRSNVVHPQEEATLVLNRPSLLRQTCSVSSEVQLDRGPFQPVPGHSQAAVNDLSHLEEEEEEEEEEVELEYESYESGGSDMSFDCASSCQSPSPLSELSPIEINESEEVQADVQPSNETPTVSGATSDNGSNSRQGHTNRSQVITQNTQLIRLVDESYESSGSEVNFDGEDSLPSTSRGPSLLVAAHLPTQMAVRLVDSYGSGSSEPWEDSGSSADEIPAAAGQQPLQATHAYLVDENYGSSSFSSDSDAAPQMPAQERSPRGRDAQQQDERQPSSAGARPERDEPQREAEELSVPSQSTSRGDMNCESHGPEMGFLADAQLEADQSPVNPEDIDVDLEDQSVHSGISNLSFDSHASYQSANDEPQGAWDEVNLDELNADMDAKSYAYSSSELTFDSDSPLLSATEHSLLDAEGLNEDDFDLDEESCVSSSSDITFDSDIPDDSVADQLRVAVYEEEPVDLENKSYESCVSEITYDSDIPLHSGNDHPEVIIQEEESAPLEGKDDNPSGSEICLDSNTNSNTKKTNSPKEEQVHIQKENEPTDSELSLNCDTLNSKPGRSEDPMTVRVSETGLDSRTPFQSVICKGEVTVKNVCPQQETHAQLPSQSAESHSEINSASSASHPVAEPYVGKKAKRKTKHLEEVRSDDEYGDSQPAAWKGDHVDSKDESTEPRGTGGNLNATGCLDSAISQPQLAVNENHVEPEDTNSRPGDSEADADSAGHFDSLSQEDDMMTKMNEWKEEAKVLEKKISELIYSKLIHDSTASFPSAMDQLELALKQINLDSNDQMSLENNSQDASSATNLDSDVSVQSVAEPPETAVLEPEHAELEGRNHGSRDSEVSCDPNDSVQLEADQHSDSHENRGQMEKDDLEGEGDEVQGFGVTSASSVPQSLAGQTEVEVVEEISCWEDCGDLEDNTVESSDSKINLHPDEPLQSVRSAAQESVQEINLLRGHVSPHDSDCEPCISAVMPISNVIFCSVIQKPRHLPETSIDPCDGPEMGADPSDPCQSVAGCLQNPVQEMNLKEDRIYLEDKSYKLVDLEPTYYPDDPAPSVDSVSVREVDVQTENQNDVENEAFQPYCSEAVCRSGSHLQSDVGPPPVFCREADPERNELGTAGSSEPCEPAVLYDPDVSFQIVVNQPQTSDGEAESPQVVLLNVVPSDSDCDREVISDSNISLQLETNDTNTDSAGPATMGRSYCRFCRCDYEASLSATNQSKESFRIINRNNDYIILGDPTCPSCGHELSFTADQPSTSQCYVSDRVRAAPEEQSPQPHCSSRSCSLEDTTRPVICQPQEPAQGASFWEVPRNVAFRDRSWASSSFAARHAARAVSVIRPTTVKHIPLKIPDADPEPERRRADGPEPDPDQPQPAKKSRDLKKVTFDMRVTKYEYLPYPWYPEEYAQAYAEEYAREYAQVYAEGYAREYAQVYAQGFAQGYAQEYAEGYAQRYAQAYAQEYAQRYAQAYAQEYAQAYAQAYAREFAREYAQGYAGGNAQEYAQEPAQEHAEGNAQENAEGNAQEPAHENAEGNAQEPAQEHAEGNAQEPAQGYAEGNAQEYAQEHAEGNAQEYAQGYAEGNAQENAQEHAEGNAQEYAQGYAEGNAQENAEGNAQEYAQEPAEGNAQEYAQEHAEGNAQEYAQEPAEGNAQEYAQEYAQEPAEGNAQEYAQEPAEGNAQGYAEGNAQENAQGNAQEPAQEHAQGNAEENAQEYAEEHAEEHAEGDPNELVHEASPQVPPPFVEETQSQVSGDEAETYTQDFHGHLYGYYHGCPETERGAASVHAASVHAASVHSEGDAGDAEDKPSCAPAEGRSVAFQDRVEGVRPGTQASPGKKRKMAGQEGELPRKKHFYYDSRNKEKAPSGSSELPAAPTAPVPPDSLVSIFSSLCMTEGQSLSQPKAKPGSDGASQAAPSRPPTTNVINAPQNPTGPDGDIAEKAGGDPGQSGASVSASTSRPSVPSASIMAAPKKRTIQRFLEDQSASAEKPAVGPAETPNANSQQTRLNRDSAKMFLKSIKKELLESKNQKKFWKKKMAATHLKMCLLKNAYKTVVLRKKSKLASEKLAMWIQLKANDILRKYGNRGPGVRRNRQSKTVLIRKQLRKKKMVAKKIKEAKKAAEEARSRLSLSISPAVPAEPQPSTAAGPAELPASLPEAAGRKRYRKQYYRRKKLLPVREYDLRSSSSFSSSDRMVTRLASKSKQ